MKYCIDTSALLDLGERHYPERLKLFAPIWEYLYDGIDNEDIVSVDYVKKELEQKADDWRTKFLTQTNKMFHISDAIEKEYAGIISEIETIDGFNKNKARDRFLKGADPWVIALARNIGQCTVVSAEKKSLADYGLGKVCEKLSVKHINWVRFFEVNNIGV